MDDAAEPERITAAEDASSAPAAGRAPGSLPTVRSLERRRLRLYLILLVGDVACLIYAFLLAGSLYLPRETYDSALLQGNLLLPVYVTIALIVGTYSQRTLADWVQAMKLALAALVIASALLNFILFFAKSNANFSRVAFALAFGLAVLGFAGLRALVLGWIRHSRKGRIANVLVIEDGGPGIALPGADLIEARRHDLDPALPDPHHRDLLGRVLANRDQVVVSCPLDRRAAWAFVLKAAGVRGEILSEPANALGAIGIARYEAQARTALVVSSGPLGIRARAAKRLFDVVLASATLVLLSPLLLLVALAIKLSDGGPVLFVQRRVGYGSRIFPMLKFRTMRPETSDSQGTASTARDDGRVTRIGRWLRRTSLDELPQLINVLRGEMSIVGPRPHALGSQAGDKLFWEVDDRYWRRHSIRPGLTGLAQVRGLRGATEVEEDLSARLQADLEYIARWSPLRDLAIVARTLRVLVHPKAY